MAAAAAAAAVAGGQAAVGGNHGAVGAAAEGQPQQVTILQCHFLQNKLDRFRIKIEKIH